MAKAAAEATARAQEREPSSVAAPQSQHQPQYQPQPQSQPQPHKEVDVVEALLAGLGLAEHLPTCLVHKMDLGAPRHSD